MEQAKFTYDLDTKSLLFDDFAIFEILRSKHRICAEAIGTLVSNSNQNEIHGPPFALNFI